MAPQRRYHRVGEDDALEYPGEGPDPRFVAPDHLDPAKRPPKKRPGLRKSQRLKKRWKRLRLKKRLRRMSHQSQLLQRRRSQPTNLLKMESLLVNKILN